MVKGFQTLVKAGATPNEYIIEQCQEKRFCTALKTFVKITEPSKFKFEKIILMRDPAKEARICLTYRASQKIGACIIFKFCPFCGGVISDNVYDRRVLRIDNNEEEIITLKYEPFTAEDYAKNNDPA